MKSHEANNVKEIIPCSLCDKIYSDKSGLVKHMDSKYPRPENDLCSNIVKIKQTELLIYIFKDWCICSRVDYGTVLMHVCGPF